MTTEYGVRIKSFEAKSLYEYNLGINFKYEWNYAMLPNSLLLDFLNEWDLYLYFLIKLLRASIILFLFYLIHL